MQIVNGLLTETSYHPSPNQDARPIDTAITGIVIHSISLPPGIFGDNYIDDFFLNRLDPNAHPYFINIAEVKVSAHLLIRRTGEIIQYVPFGQRAWHAGVSSWDGRERCNDFTIGIELEGSDHDKYEPAQYIQLSRVIKLLKKTIPTLSQQYLKGHDEISPGRKTDPGPYFDWDYLMQLLA